MDGHSFFQCAHALSLSHRRFLKMLDAPGFQVCEIAVHAFEALRIDGNLRAAVQRGWILHSRGYDDEPEDEAASKREGIAHSFFKELLFHHPDSVSRGAAFCEFIRLPLNLSLHFFKGAMLT
jgi:hypothetical protein